ncbi:MAG: hypothetical protein HRU18_02795 [Pseudoalteromonas sp.]|uniref:hypothetical protein n=1 Tax=Pseudoalteromonas sp. TaxID=53249 RepID=UPI001D3CBF71|nr:hypothetical protein [Pseudoalteromonas sp.]NRA77112.1 hypothetical protein [Pseudoalteromonas sp.]
MNIKGKHLQLIRYLRDRRGLLIADAVNAGFELNMINSLCYNKQVLAITDGKLYIPTETANRTNLYIHK